jgi:hypothetical protein
MRKLNLTVSCLIFFAAFILNLGCSKGGEDNLNTNPQDTLSQTTTKKWIVSTVAGTGQPGSANGPDSLSTFNYPSYLALDSNGNIYVSEVGTFGIRKIAAGNVTMYTDRSMSTSDLTFGNIYGMVIDKQNNVYDVEYELIRKIVSPNTSYVFAGSLEVSHKDGKDTAARFAEINRITADKSGNFYLPSYDPQAHFYIRKITPDGTVSTLTLNDNTGYNSGSDPSHFYLSPIAVDNSGNIFFTSNGNELIKKRDPQGNVTVFAGAGTIGFTDGKGTAAQFFNILALTTDSIGNLYVADASNHAIRVVTPDGTVSTIVGKGGQGFRDGEIGIAKFFNPMDIAIYKNALYVADAGNNRIRKIEYK